MNESGEVPKVGRRGAVKLLLYTAAGVTAAGIGIGAKKGVDEVLQVMQGLKNHENLANYLGARELFDKHANYRLLTIREGANVYSEPRKERSGVVGDIGTTRIGTETFQGTLAQGESIKVTDAFLLLVEADKSTDPAWIRPFAYEGVTKNADIRKCWAMFEVKGQNLTDSIKGIYSNGIACVPIEGSNIDFGDGFEPNPQKVSFSDEITFGRIT